MSANINILTSGYADTVDERGAPEPNGSHMRATGSCCLVRSGGHKILFDTMGPWERDELISKLAELHIHTDDIDHLVCSHSHPDHVGNLNLFTRAKKHFVGTSVYSGDIYDLSCFEPAGSYEYVTRRDIKLVVPYFKPCEIDANLSVQHTPGHTMECITLIVNNCDHHGKVALAGDLFERAQDVLDEGIWLGAGSQNPDLQRANRSRIYNETDYILPGHGPLFKTNHNETVKF